MGRDGYYWSVDDCGWLPCPEATAPPMVGPLQRVSAEQAISPEQPVVAEAETT
jgi:hypothetical protein